MRVRRKKHGAERISACAEYSATLPIASFKELFGNDNSVRIEIGCGKGTFICQNAEKYPDVNFLAIERVSDVLVCCAEKIKERQLSNVRFMCVDARQLEELPEGSIETIYLNFSDPWPKKGYAKRRLTHTGFLEIYKKLLNKDGRICLKTDNVGLFDFSLEQFELCGLTVSDVTRDLHNSEFAEGNIMTEYEANFVKQGIKINRAVASL